MSSYIVHFGYCAENLTISDSLYLIRAPGKALVHCKCELITLHDMHQFVGQQYVQHLVLVVEIDTGDLLYPVQPSQEGRSVDEELLCGMSGIAVIKQIAI